MTIPLHTPKLTCNLTAIPADQRAQHIDRATALLTDSQAKYIELSNGLMWQFPLECYPDVTQFVANEQRCCSFFNFSITILPAQAGVQLAITGTLAVRAFLESELAQLSLPAIHDQHEIAAPNFDDYAVVCELATLSAQEAAKLTQLARNLLGSDDSQQQELADGYAWLFPLEAYAELISLMELNSRCCGFLLHRLEIQATEQQIQLFLTGSSTAKAAIQADLERLRHEPA